MKLIEVVICLVIISIFVNLSYPYFKPIGEVIQTETQVVKILEKIRKNRQKSLDLHGEPVKIDGVTYWPTRCSSYTFTAGNKLITLNDYYVIKVIKCKKE